MFSSVYLKTNYFRLKLKIYFFNRSEGKLAVLSVFRFKPLVFSWEQVFSAGSHILTLRCVAWSIFKWRFSSCVCGIFFSVHYLQN